MSSKKRKKNPPDDRPPPPPAAAAAAVGSSSSFSLSSSLRDVLEQGDPTDMALRLLFGTILYAGKDRCYRIRDLEIYAATDPYTHASAEQVSSSGGWYFHRCNANPNASWKGGTFMGLDVTFGPVGTAGGILLRGISEINNSNNNGSNDSNHDGETPYIDGPCNVVRELLHACGGYTKIADLVHAPPTEPHRFSWDAFYPDGILRLVEEDPCLNNTNGSSSSGVPPSMKWKACTRVGLSAPEKILRKNNNNNHASTATTTTNTAQTTNRALITARQEFWKKPLRFLTVPIQTKKQRNVVLASNVGGIYHTLVRDHEDDDNNNDGNQQLQQQQLPVERPANHHHEKKQTKAFTSKYFSR